ncbi:hypothetical protein V6Z12_D11G136000 [Gossypium hirsutum]
MVVGAAPQRGLLAFFAQIWRRRKVKITEIWRHDCGVRLIPETLGFLISCGALAFGPLFILGFGPHKPIVIWT